MAYTDIPGCTQYGRIVGGSPPFEDVALSLVEAGDPEALQLFLQTKLQVCGCAGVC